MNDPYPELPKFFALIDQQARLLKAMLDEGPEDNSVEMYYGKIDEDETRLTV
jgi:hypothetical protein